MAGLSIPWELPAKEVAWLKRDVLLFAARIGCSVEKLQFLYESHPEFAVFPTCPTILRTWTAFGHLISNRTLRAYLEAPSLAFKLKDQDVTDYFARESLPLVPGTPKFDPKRGVDGQRKLTVSKPLPTTRPGRSFELRSRVIGVYDKGTAGTIIETEQWVDRDSDEVYSQVIGSAFLVGQGNWGRPKGQNPKTTTFPKIKWPM
ncbi:uncharacterized protein Z519_04990 [Cladophialophora bantiana CBS 173.52]|uniref:Peroxisomal multifunctional enzyme type 2-like N-terminal domain-containing protein n=1 Tax=Cladophialophora bantiana (strain ATCC 10958 / CBS 173.52 / CDC B-1940 / NIH 8579) TaxID=1442370 RepID=A0A0D2HVS2_CLAB1|nr:uncharacterized protein Z519_04990 [Cladophialophora bantiana CBS 173.52]KIW95010.1 hypothetical protein Z519_04990 [Cladophialophora bantiana CBS 173.52]